MRKAVFRNSEVKRIDDTVILRLMKNYQPEVDEAEIEDLPEYLGPTADELMREADEFRARWEVEKNSMLEQARQSADAILKKAEEAAAEETKRRAESAQAARADAESRAKTILDEARAEAEKLVNEAQSRQEEIKKTAHDEGFTTGREEGFQEGNKEANRLIDRLHTIIERVLDKRQAILEETEQQVVELVLLMTRKVVKTITDTQRGVVTDNIVQALRKVKGRGDVTIRVNLADTQLATEHAEEFIKSVESITNIAVVEDSGIDKGGCVVETDFGAIDARISSQLGELERKILEISPIKTIDKPAKSGALPEDD